MKKLSRFVSIAILSVIVCIPVSAYADITTNQYSASILTGNVKNDFNLTYKCPSGNNTASAYNSLAVVAYCVNTSQDLSETYSRSGGTVEQKSVDIGSAAGVTKTCTDDKNFSYSTGNGSETISGCPALRGDPYNNGTTNLTSAPLIDISPNIGGYSYTYKYSPNKGFVQSASVNVRSLLEFKPVAGFENNSYDITIKISQIQNDTFVAETLPTDPDPCPNGYPGGGLSSVNTLGGASCGVPVNCSNISIDNASLTSGAGYDDACLFTLKGIKGQSEIDITPSTGAPWFKYITPTIVSIVASSNNPPKPSLVSLNTSDTMPANATDMGSISSSDASVSESAVLGVTMDPTKQAALNQYLQQLYDPSSPNYHNYLTPDQYTQNYGRTPAEMATLTDWLSSQGFTNISPSSNTSVIDFTGTLGQLQTAFNVTFDKYSVPITSNASTISSAIVSKGGKNLSTTTSIICYAANESESVPSNIATLTSGFVPIGKSCANPPQPASGTSTPTPIKKITPTTTNSIPATPIYSCPAKYMLIPSNNTCSPLPSVVQTMPAIRTYSCPNGYSQISSTSPTCKSSSGKSVLAAKIAYSCPTEYVLNGITCKRSTAANTVSATITYSCPLNYILNTTNHTCSITISSPIKSTTSLAKPAFTIVVSALALVLAAFLH